MSDDQKHVELAISLFERGYPEHRIEAALRHCSTLESAVTWLEHDQLVLARLLPDDDNPDHKRKNKKTSAAPNLTQRASMRENAHEHEAVQVAASPLRARNEMKSSSSFMEFEAILDEVSSKEQSAAVSLDSPVKIAAVQAPVLHPTGEDQPEASTGTPRDREEASSVQIRPLGSSEAKAWWRNAASRWLQIIECLKTGATSPKRVAADADVDAPMKKLRIDGQSPSASCENPDLEASSEKLHSPSSATAAHGAHSPRARPASPGTSPRAQMRYNRSQEMCALCCEDVAIGDAVALGCRHGWYCRNCMQRHAEARLEVGAAHVACPECAAPIADCNLRRLLASETMERLLARSLEQAVAATSDLWVCPTPNCPVRVSLEEGDLPMLQCTECGKQSCLHCGAQPYHKGLTCEEYAERCRSRGRKKAAEQAEESFRQWMQETGTMKCPTCSIAISKQNLQSQSTQYQECHKMMCRNCKTKFCFKCGKVLTDTFTCRCSITAHGFVDPHTGKRVQHLKAEKTPSKAGRPPKRKGGH